MSRKRTWKKRTYKDAFSPRSRSFDYFEKSISKYRRLLYASMKGLEEDAKSTKELSDSLEQKVLEQLGELPVIPKGYKLQHPLNIQIHENADGSASIEGEPELITMMIKGFAAYGEEALNIEFDLHNIIIVASWSTFEGYVHEVLQEIFSKRPDLLSAERQMRVSDVLAAKDDILGKLIDDEVEDVGRKSFADLNRYLPSRLKVSIPKANFDRMSEAYLVRNIVAHTAGRVRKSQRHLLPATVELDGDDLRLSREYVLQTMHCIEDCVIKLDDHFRAKFLEVPAEHVSSSLKTMSNSVSG